MENNGEIFFVEEEGESRKGVVWEDEERFKVRYKMKKKLDFLLYLLFNYF